MFKNLRVEESQGTYLEYPTGGWNTPIKGTQTVGDTCCELRKLGLSGLPDVLQNSKFMFITSNLITMLGLLNNTTFSTAIHCASDIKRTKSETSNTPLLDALCDINTERQKHSKLLWSMIRRSCCLLILARV